MPSCASVSSSRRCRGHRHSLSTRPPGRLSSPTTPTEAQLRTLPLEASPAPWVPSWPTQHPTTWPGGQVVRAAWGQEGRTSPSARLAQAVCPSSPKVRRVLWAG